MAKGFIMRQVFLLPQLHKKMLVQTVLVSAMVSICLCAPSFMENISPEREARARLYDDLAAHRALSNKLSPLNMDGEVDVEFEIWVKRVAEIVEAKQTIQTHMYVSMTWKDPSLAWNREDYGNVSDVRIPSDNVWHPIAYIANTAFSSWLGLSESAIVKLQWDGTMRIENAEFAITHCTFDLTYYPFDSQSCVIVLTYDGSGTKLRPSKVFMGDPYNRDDDSSLFNYQGEWEIQDRVIVPYSDVYDFGAIGIAVEVKRATLYYILCVLLPMIATSLLTLLVFWIPPASGEKMSYLVSIYVSTSLFVNFVGDTLPRNMSGTNTPRMMLFLVFVIGECVLALAATVCVMRRYQQEKEADAQAPKDTDDGGDDAKENSPGSIARFDSLDLAMYQETKVADFEDKYHMTVTDRFRKVFGSYPKRIPCSCGRTVQSKVKALSATTLDFIFFCVFSVTCVLFYALVFWI